MSFKNITWNKNLAKDISIHYFSYIQPIAVTQPTNLESRAKRKISIRLSFMYYICFKYSFVNRIDNAWSSGHPTFFTMVKLIILVQSKANATTWSVVSKSHGMWTSKIRPLFIYFSRSQCKIAKLLDA